MGGANLLDREIGNEGAKKHALLSEMYCTLGFMIVEPRDQCCALLSQGV